MQYRILLDLQRKTNTNTPQTIQQNSKRKNRSKFFFYNANTTLIPKPDNSQLKKNDKLISLINLDENIKEYPT